MAKSDNVLDLEELFNNTNGRDIEIDFEFLPEPNEKERRSLRISVLAKRPTNTCTIKLFVEGQQERSNNVQYEQPTEQLFRDGNTRDVVAGVREVSNAFSSLLN